MSQVISGVMQLPTQADMNKLVIPGKYAGVSGGVVNGPNSTITATYRLEVKPVSVNTQTIQQYLEFRTGGATRVFVRFGTNSTGSNWLGGTWTFNSWEEYATPTNGFTSTATVKAATLTATGQVTGTYVGSSGRVVAGTSVEGASATFTGVVTCTSVNQTSDESLKTDIADIDSALIAIAKSVSPKQYVFTFDDTKTVHFGFMAQDLIDAFTQAGLDFTKYSLVNIVTSTGDNGEATNHYAINYTELMLLRSL